MCDPGRVFPAWAAADTERVTRTFPIADGGTLRLNNFSGRVTITGTSASEVTIDATRHGSRSQLEHVSLEMTSDRSQVRIDANQRDSSAFTGDGDSGVDTMPSKPTSTSRCHDTSTWTSLSSAPR